MNSYENAQDFDIFFSIVGIFQSSWFKILIYLHSWFWYSCICVYVYDMAINHLYRNFGGLSSVDTPVKYKFMPSTKICNVQLLHIIYHNTYLVLNALGKFIYTAFHSRCRQSGMYCWPYWGLSTRQSSARHATVYWIFTLFYYKRFHTTYTLRCKYVCVRVWYICVFVCIHVFVCIWVLVWSSWYVCAYICACVGECVFAIFTFPFNSTSVLLHTIYIAHCAIMLLFTLMLYIWDRSTPDLNSLRPSDAYMRW